MIRALFIILISYASASSLFGQREVFYYGSNNRPVKGESEAVLLQEVNKISSRKYVIRTRTFFNENWTQVKKEKIKVRSDGSQRIYYTAESFFPKRVFRKMDKIGPDEFQFTESTLTSTIRTGRSTSYLPLHLEGTVTVYHPNGEIKSISEYHDNKLISNENWTSDGSKYIDSLFYSVDQEPEYQMGDNFFKAFLINKLKESKLDLTQIEDQVVIGWVVMENGELDGVIALKGKSRQLNQILVNTVAQLPGYWTPAILDGKKVRYFMSIPLNFLQREAKFQDIEFSAGVMHYNRY